MGVEDNKKTVQLVEEVWNRGDLDSLDQYYASNFDNSQSAVPGMTGLANAKMVHQMSMQAFPDRKTEVVELIGEADKVMARVHVTGTNKGGVPWFGAPANNAKVDFEWISIYRFNSDGKIAGHYGLNDAYMLGIQLGAIAPPSMG